MPVDLSMNGMVHRAVLRELDRICDLVDDGNGAAARQHWDFLSEQLRLHHETEDEYLWSVVRGRTEDPAQITTIDAMEAEHGQLHDALDRCDADFAGGGTSLPDSTHADLASLRLLVAAHFAHEEKEGEPILAAHLQPDDLKPFNEANKQSPNAMIVFPWIADGGTPADQRVYDVLPGPVRIFLKPLMQRKYRSHFG